MLATWNNVACQPERDVRGIWRLYEYALWSSAFQLNQEDYLNSHSFSTFSLPPCKSAHCKHSLSVKPNRFCHNWINQSRRCHQTLNCFPLCRCQLSFQWKIVATLLHRICLQFIFSVGPTHQSPPHPHISTPSPSVSRLYQRGFYTTHIFTFPINGLFFSYKYKW